ncbi:MAG: hypothetical protein HY246_17750 [Proteobacteria bacterium]|nr:hypothetical protein [Pseudomonadota bacterium]
MLGRLFSGSSSANNADLPGRIIQHEVMVHFEKHWVIDSIVEDEAQAIARAQTLLEDPKNDEVKVVRQRSMAATGFTTEKPIFEATQTPRNKKEIGLSATINEAPACVSLDDFFSLDSRVIMSRLFREFLDSMIITPTELLHNHGYIKKLDNAGTLISSAVYQVAQVQSKAGQGTVKERAAAIDGFLREVQSMARDVAAERRKLPTLEEGQFMQLVRRVEARYETSERQHRVLASLANYLAGASSWGQKLTQIAGLITEDIEPECLRLLDGVIADALGAGQMVQEILGAQSNLASALALLADLSTGRLDKDPPQASECLKLLIKLIRTRNMPSCRAVLFDRLVRELKSTKPLNRNDTEQERAALNALTERLKGEDGKLIGGAVVEKALAVRTEALRKALLQKMGVVT